MHELFSRYGASGGHAAHLGPSQYGFCSSRSCGKDTVSRSNTACPRCALALVFVLVGSVRRTACDALVFIKSVHLSNGRDTRRIGTRFRMACTRALADTLVPIKYGLDDGYSRHRYPSQYGCSSYSHDTRRASSRSMLRVSVWLRIDTKYPFGSGLSRAFERTHKYEFMYGFPRVLWAQPVRPVRRARIVSVAGDAGRTVPVRVAFGHP